MSLHNTGIRMSAIKMENLRGTVRHAVLSILVIALVPMAVGCKGYGRSTGGAPSISSVSPTSGPVGTSVTIHGANFGAAQGYNTVKFNGTAAIPTSWGATNIVAPVPTGAATGNVVVTVGGAASNGVTFTVTTGTVSLPIKATANNRYLVDQNNVPWLMVLDAGHHITCALAQSNWNAYFADGHAKGYTEINCFSTYA